MKLSVLHRTTFNYGGQVIDSQNTLHLEPRLFQFQRTISSVIRILPATRLIRFRDLFDNVSHQFEVIQPHHCLVVESRLKVENFLLDIKESSKQAGLEDYANDEVRDEIWHFLQSSYHIKKNADVWKQALDLCSHVSSVYDKAWVIMRWIYESFIYESGVTSVHTTMLESYQIRRGVCQDFAHVMIGMCRSLGIPCRYASGYLYNGPKDHLIGSQASHAWCEVYLIQTGWIGFDPTNGNLADERYIKIAIGRDYADVAPISGSYRGSGYCEMNVVVEVEKID